MLKGFFQHCLCPCLVLKSNPPTSRSRSQDPTTTLLTPFFSRKNLLWWGGGWQKKKTDSFFEKKNSRVFISFKQGSTKSVWSFFFLLEDRRRRLMLWQKLFVFPHNYGRILNKNSLDYFPWTKHSYPVKVLLGEEDKNIVFYMYGDFPTLLFLDTSGPTNRVRGCGNIPPLFLLFECHRKSFFLPPTFAVN